MNRRYAKDQDKYFKWHDPDWMPTKAQDLLWVNTGFESIDRYIRMRIRDGYTAPQMAQESGLKPITILMRMSDRKYSTMRNYHGETCMTKWTIPDSWR